MTTQQDSVDVERLLRDLATYLPSIRVFLTSRQHPHEAGLQWHDDLTAKVAVAADGPTVDRERVAWAIIRAMTDENIREVKRYGNAGPIADAVLTALSLPITQRDGQGDQARREAIMLLDEINKQAKSRAFYGIHQTLHAKLCTIRMTLARPDWQAPATAIRRLSIEQGDQDGGAE